MSEDIVRLVCPSCRSFVPFTVYSGPGKDEDYTIDSASLPMITEINEASRKGECECFSCGCQLAVPVRFIADVVPFSEAEQYDKRWKKA